MMSEENGKYKQDIINTYRSLWANYAQWVRMLIISNTANLPDLSYTSKRLIKNTSDFANEMRKYYSKEKANILEELLMRNLFIVRMLIDNIKINNIQEADEYRKEWYENADDIAEFLSDINSYYNKHEWRAMLYDSLFMTEKEIAYRLKGDYESEISEYDSIESQILRIADMMSEGIIKQSNNKFCTGK